MIEDKKLGLKIAESPEEKMWYDYVQQKKKDLKAFEMLAKVTKEELLLGTRKLNEAKRKPKK